MSVGAPSTGRSNFSGDQPPILAGAPGDRHSRGGRGRRQGEPGAPSHVSTSTYSLSPHLSCLFNLKGPPFLGGGRCPGPRRRPLSRQESPGRFMLSPNVTKIQTQLNNSQFPILDGSFCGVANETEADCWQRVAEVLRMVKAMFPKGTFPLQSFCEMPISN